MKPVSKVFPRRIDRELHLSEQSVWQTLAELYRVGWLQSISVDKMYIERIQKMPPPEKGTQEWQRIALVSVPEAEKTFGRLILVLQLQRYDSDNEYWGTAYHVQVWTERAEQITGMKPLRCLRKAGSDPLLWVSDRENEELNCWKTIDLLSEKKKREFVRRFLEYLESPDRESPEETRRFFARMKNEEPKFRAFMKNQRKLQDERVERTLKHLAQPENANARS